MREPDDCPRPQKRASRAREKRFGYEQWSDHFRKWMFARWFLTEKARAQSLEDLKRKTTILKRHGIIPRYRKISR